MRSKCRPRDSRPPSSHSVKAPSFIRFLSDWRHCEIGPLWPIWFQRWRRAADGDCDTSLPLSLPHSSLSLSLFLSPMNVIWSGRGVGHVTHARAERGGLGVRSITTNSPPSSQSSWPPQSLQAHTCVLFKKGTSATNSGKNCEA